MSSNQIETLSNNFNTLLNEYKKTYADFINSINSKDNTFSTVENSAFLGNSIINTISAANITGCTKSCSSNASCSGATFTNNNCALSSGTGNIVNKKNSTAIVKKGIYYSYKLQKLNEQLMTINKEINNSVNQTNKNYQNNLGVINQREKALQQNYVVLTQERNQIEKMVRDFETLNSAQENGDINVTMNYYNYIVLLFIVVLLILLFLRFSIPEQQYGGRKVCNFISKIFNVCN